MTFSHSQAHHDWSLHSSFVLFSLSAFVSFLKFPSPYNPLFTSLFLLQLFIKSFSFTITTIPYSSFSRVLWSTLSFWGNAAWTSLSFISSPLFPSPSSQALFSSPRITLNLRYEALDSSAFKNASHSRLLFGTLIVSKRMAETTPSARRNANGVLLFPWEASMMADETNGPMNAEVLPTCGYDGYCRPIPVG